AFSALIGNCAIPADCTYNGLGDRQDPAGTSGIHNTEFATNFSTLDYIPLQRSWSTNNGSDTSAPFDPFLGFRRHGVYITSQFPIPEPSAFLLLAVGFFVAVRKLR